MRKDVAIILDPGHGGMKNGKYVTAPAKMYVHDDEEKTTVYEGVFNREIVERIQKSLKGRGITVYTTVNGPDDLSLKSRVEFANGKAKQFKHCVFISVHGNAGKGTGFEVFTSKGETYSDTIADYYIEAMKEEFPGEVARVDLTDGDKDKEANFYVLKNTICPAILTENFFMDNLEDAKLMNSFEGKRKIANAHIKMIEKVLNELDFDKKPEPKKKPALEKKKTTTKGKKAGGTTSVKK